MINSFPDNILTLIAILGVNLGQTVTNKEVNGIVHKEKKQGPIRGLKFLVFLSIY